MSLFQELNDHKPIWCLVTTEAVPFSKLGGLADYIHSFAQALHREGYQVVVFSPYYEKCMLSDHPPINGAIQSRNLDFMGSHSSYEAHYARHAGIHHVLLRSSAFFGYDKMWDPDFSPQHINHTIQIYQFLGKIVHHELVVLSQERPLSQITIQANDWISGFFAAYLELSPIAADCLTCVFCIHNLGPGYYGRIYDSDRIQIDDALKPLVLASDARNWSEFLWPFFDKFITVSENYHNELINTPQWTFLQKQNELGNFRGFLNGIASSTWERQSLCDEDLQVQKLSAFSEIKSEYNIPQSKVRLLSFIGRITKQKGLEFIQNVLHAGIPDDIQFVILGEGDPLVKYINTDIHSNLTYLPHYSDDLCKKLMLASDFILVPSHFEPCGYVPMYACLQGSIPLMRATGGLVNIGAKIKDKIGLDVNFRDLEQFQLILRDLLALPPSHLADAARKICELDWGWDGIKALIGFVHERG